MPLEDPQVIDVVRKTEDGKIVLVITDAGAIADPKERVVCLVQKLKVYINSIVSGDLKRDFPDKTSRDYVIEVACNSRPTLEMLNITQVMPRKDPANTVPVKFVEFPEGAWGPSRPEPTWCGDSPQTKPEDKLGGQLDGLSIAALEKGVEIAEYYLAEGEKGFYFAVLGWDGNKTDAVYFRETEVTNEVVDEVEQYVRELTPAFTVCVLVSVENVKGYERGQREAIVLTLYRRGHGQGLVYARPVQKKGVLKKYRAAGSLELVGTRPGLMAG